MRREATSLSPSPWLTFLIIAVLVAMPIAAATPSGSETSPSKGPPPEGGSVAAPAEGDPRPLADDEAGAAIAVGIFFWGATLLAVVIFVVRLLYDPTV